MNQKLSGRAVLAVPACRVMRFFAFGYSFLSSDSRFKDDSRFSAFRIVVFRAPAYFF